MLRDIMEGLALLATVPADGQDANWETKGRCARHPDPDLWFAPVDEDSTRYDHLNDDPREKARVRLKDRNHAKEMCRACPVAAQCLRYALAHGGSNEDADFGIWGGLDKRDRTRLKNRLAAKEVAA